MKKFLQTWSKMLHPRKKMLAIFAAMLCMMALMPMTARAETINTVSSHEELTKTSTVYVGEVVVDGVSEIKYLYSDDITLSSVLLQHLLDGLNGMADGDYAALLEAYKDNGYIVLPEQRLALCSNPDLIAAMDENWRLLSAMYGGNIQLRLLGKDTNINHGAIFENLVAQEFYAHGFAMDHNLFYFNSKKQGELDFVLEKDGAVLPIEVKSGKDYERHRALSNVMQNAEYAIPQAIVLCQDNLKVVERTVYLPIYMLMFLQQPKLDDLIVKFDLTQGLSL